MEDVDLAGGEALVAWQVQQVDGSLLRRHTKTPSSNAPLPLPEIAVQALERHRVEEARRRLAAGDMWGDCGLVFRPGLAIRSTHATSIRLATGVEPCGSTPVQRVLCDDHAPRGMHASEATSDQQKGPPTCAGRGNRTPTPACEATWSRSGGGCGSRSGPRSSHPRRTRVAPRC